MRVHVLPALALVIVLACPGATSASAQDRPAPVVEAAAGALVFPDDGEAVREGFLGGAARFYLSPRVSIGPEVAFVSGDSHVHFMLTGNVTFDLLRPTGRRPRAFTPFVVVGGGLFQTRHEFAGASAFTHTEGAFTAGGGVRARVRDRVILGAEARVGWETHLRVNGFVGFTL